MRNIVILTQQDEVAVSRSEMIGRIAMKKAICKIASVIMVVLTVIAIIGAVTVTGSGFLDLSNIVRYFLIGFAVVFGIAAVVTGRYGWMSR